MLNKEQQKAIKHSVGPLLVIAGAGTGKTTVITERIKYLISKNLAKPNEILALTFTEKAAHEMEERVDKIMPYGYTQMWIMTFHSFCDRILRAEGLHIGLDTSYKLLTSAQAVKLLRDNIFKFNLRYFRPFGNPNKFIWGMLSHFSRLQDENISPNDYLKWAKKFKAKSKEEKLEKEKWLELANAYKAYEELKTKNSYLDFGDLIIKALTLFEKRPNILQQYQKQFKYILIDEFQDTNYAQNQLAIKLAGKTANISVVGDDDQSVYRFRGAAVSNILQFRKNFPHTKVVVLTKNYRSGQKILDAAYKLIQFNNPDRLEVIEKVNKKLIAERKDILGSLEFVHEKRVENEAEAVVNKIQQLIENKSYTFGDFAILVRANDHAGPFIRALERSDIPYQFLGPGKLFSQAEIVDLISILRVFYNIEDSSSFFNLLSNKYFEINPQDVARFTSFARKKNLPFFYTCERMDEMNLSQEGQEKIKKICKTINEGLADSPSKTGGQILYDFLNKSGTLQKILDDTSLGNEQRAANFAKFFDKLKVFESENKDASVTTLVDWINLSIEVGESPVSAEIDWSESDVVNILTVHGSKGLEFPVVFLVNLVTERFPSRERREQIPIPDELIKEVLPKGDYHMEEERRLFYVGMTRARDILYLTASDFYGEGKRVKKLSPFIFESLGDEVLALEEEKSVKQLSFVDYSKKGNLQATKNKPSIHIDYLSYSQIETFEICPLHYKLRYIYNVPTPTTAPLSLGNSFHLTLKEFYDQVESGTKPSINLLNNLLAKNWIDEGYQNKLHERQAKDTAQKYLKFYFQNWFDPKNIPLALEQPFILKIEDFKVGGKIDRIDKKGDTIEIIDYKTGGGTLSQEEAQKNLQLSIYGLAASKLSTPPFGHKIEKIELSLYYFDSKQIVTTTRTLKELLKAEEEIVGWRKKIEESDFRCSGHPFCQACEYSLFCKSEQKIDKL